MLCFYQFYDCSKYKEEQHIASEYKEEISYQLRMKANLESTLPSTIIIGPFVINTDVVKQYLVNKRNELAQKLMEQFAVKMRNCILEVFLLFCKLPNQLHIKPSNQRSWMNTRI